MTSCISGDGWETHVIHNRNEKCDCGKTEALPIEIYCSDCEHYVPYSGYYDDPYDESWCQKFNDDCSVIRNSGPCGKDAKYFEPKEG